MNIQPSSAALIKRIYIFDPCFGSLTGHWENYCKRLYNELYGRGYEVVVYGQHEFSEQIIGSTKFRPLFHTSPTSSANHVFDFYHQKDQLIDDFNKIDENEFQDGDLFIFHSLLPQTFLAILEWTKKISSKKKILSTFFFQLPPSDSITNAYNRIDQLQWIDNNNVRFYQLCIDTLKPLIAKGSHILFASTDVLSRNFSFLLQNKVHYLPMPGPKMEYTDEAMDALDKTATIKIGYFGHSSFAKGGQFLQYIVEKTISKFKHVKFILHVNPNKETEKYLEFFKTHNIANVECHFGHLDQDNIMELMNEVDIILMPYSAIKYATTPSAVFAEGMPLCKILVLPKDTWAYSQAVKYETGFVSFAKYNHRSISKALIKAIQQFPSLRKKSFLGGKRFYNENNISFYINEIENFLSKMELPSVING